MIRNLRKEDIYSVMKIWLDANITVHSFISEDYWKNNYELVSKLLPQSQVFVYGNDNDGEISGFIGMNDDYIAGIFVCEKLRSEGIGKQLLDYVKSINQYICLSVYEKNKRAVNFYLREDFKINGEDIDKNTGESEYFMVWEKAE